jgi:hypothetical protein
MQGQAWHEQQQRDFLAKQEKQVTYPSLRAVLDDFRSRIDQINRNYMLPDKAKARRKGEAKRDFRDIFYRTKAQIEQRQQGELQAAWRKANPAPNVSNLSPGEVQARQEVLEDIQRIADATDGTGKGEAILDLYARYYNQGYDIGMDTIAQRAGRHLNADQAKELQGLEETRNPGLAESRKAYAELRQKQGNEATGGALIESVFLSSTALSGAEAEAMAEAKKQAAADAFTADKGSE